MNRAKHLKAFKEAIARAKMIKKDLDQINYNIGSFSYRQQRDLAETAYIQTLQQIIDEGEKYLSLNVEADESIRVAIDMNKHQEILENLI